MKKIKKKNVKKRSARARVVLATNKEVPVPGSYWLQTCAVTNDV
jgi:hypothetical protein